MAGKETKIDYAAAMVMEPTTAADWLIVAPVATAIIGAAFTMMVRKNTQHQAWMALVFLALITVEVFMLLSRVAELGPLTMVMSRWLPPFGIAFTADLIGVTLAAISCLVILVGTVFSLSDSDTTDIRYGFYPLILMMTAGVCGAFLTGDLFNLYVWFEVLLISSYGLLILGARDVQMDGAIKYAFLNLIATTFFLIAVGLLYGLVGTLNMADILLKVGDLPESAPVGTIAMLILVAFGMKAAAFPVNFWLPASYHAPRITVAALMAGLMTKVGVYALIRSVIMLVQPDEAVISNVIAFVAVATMITGAIGALAQDDIRRMFGYLVIAGVGTMLAGAAAGSQEGIAGTFLYAVHSIAVMTALYLAAGMINNAAGSFRLSKGAGLYKASPLMSIFFFILFLSVAGLPPFSGFLPKIMLVSASLNTGFTWLAATILVAGLLTTIAVSRVWLLMFWRNEVSEAVDEGSSPMPDLKDSEHPPQVNSAPTWFAVGALVVVVTLLGLQPEWVLGLLDPGAETLLSPDAYIDSVFGTDTASESGSGGGE